ncbi:MAG: imidazolonepropionase [Bacteroidetes bacterium]|nr:MAG: imidazolonepropionase [Bacteroidota bacterium]
MSTLIYNINTLVHTEQSPKSRYLGKEMANLVCVNDAFLYIVDGKISDFGKSNPELIKSIKEKDPSLIMHDAENGHVFPSWVDAHTHIVFAGNRELEFENRIKGLSYEEIALRGGGILNSAKALKDSSEDDLVASASRRLNEMKSLGTGAVEIKSGYGLSVESELKMLRVIKRLKKESPLIIKATFLGAHAIPEEFKGRKKDYLQLLIKEVMPVIQQEGLAEFCDIFCEKNYFSSDDTLELMEAAKNYGMTAKVHAEQLSHSGGIAAGIKSGAISVDHLEFASDEDILELRNSETMPVLLPGAQLFLGLQNPPARKMIDSGCSVALSTDFNPGSCPSGNMNQMVSLACILYKMTPAEVIIAATSNSAYAMELENVVGSICRGKIANLFITPEISSYAFLPYSFGSNLVKKVFLKGVMQ